MDKDKIKAQLGEAATKAKAAMSEIKANFKADEGTSGARKYQSMFVNLWKSGTTGKGALIACSVVVLLLLVSVFGGGGKSGAASGGAADVASGESVGGTSAAVAQKARRPVPTDTLVVKGLYMRMSGDDALEACKELVASSKDLVVVDLRKGIEIEREVGLGEYEKKQEDEWRAHLEKRSRLINQGVSQAVVDKRFKNYDFNEWKKAHPPSEKDIAASKEKIKEVVGKKNLIQISIKKNGVREDKLDGLCFVWIDDKGNVEKVYFNGDGMDRFFGELPVEEFAQALVNNYSGIPSLKPECLRDNLEQYGSIETTTWIYKDNKGYQVKLFECAYIAPNGKRFNSDKNLNLEVAYYLSTAGKGPKKFFAISAIKPESVRKFD